MIVINNIYINTMISALEFLCTAEELWSLDIWPSLAELEAKTVVRLLTRIKAVRRGINKPMY